MDWTKVFEVFAQVLGPQAAAMVVGGLLVFFAVRAFISERKVGRAEPTDSAQFAVLSYRVEALEKALAKIDDRLNPK